MASLFLLSPLAALSATFKQVTETTLAASGTTITRTHLVAIVDKFGIGGDRIANLPAQLARHGMPLKSIPTVRHIMDANPGLDPTRLMHQTIQIPGTDHFMVTQAPAPMPQVQMDYLPTLDFSSPANMVISLAPYILLLGLTAVVLATIYRYRRGIARGIAKWMGIHTHPSKAALESGKRLAGRRLGGRFLSRRVSTTFYSALVNGLCARFWLWHRIRRICDIGALIYAAYRETVVRA